MKAYSLELAEGSRLANASIASGTSFPSLPDTGEFFWKVGSGVGLYVYGASTWDQIAILDIVPQVYKASGQISGKPKMFADTVTSNSSGVFTVDISSAGFTQTPVATATVISNASGAYDKPFATITSISATSITGTVIKGIQTILIAGTSAQFAGVQTVAIIVVGK